MREIFKVFPAAFEIRAIDTLTNLYFPTNVFSQILVFEIVSLNRFAYRDDRRSLSSKKKERKKGKKKYQSFLFKHCYVEIASTKVSFAQSPGTLVRNPRDRRTTTTRTKLAKN